MNKEMIAFATAMQADSFKRLEEISEMKGMRTGSVSEIVQNIAERFNEHYSNFLEKCPEDNNPRIVLRKGIQSLLKTKNGSYRSVQTLNISHILLFQIRLV